MTVASSLKNRKHKRRAFSLAVDLLSDEGVVMCELLDISSGGAKVNVSKVFEKGKKVELRLENFGALKSYIVWCDKKKHGLQFLDDQDEIAEILMALATYG